MRSNTLTSPRESLVNARSAAIGAVRKSKKETVPIYSTVPSVDFPVSIGVTSVPNIQHDNHGIMTSASGTISSVEPFMAVTTQTMPYVPLFADSVAVSSISFMPSVTTDVTSCITGIPIATVRESVSWNALMEEATVHATSPHATIYDDHDYDSQTSGTEFMATQMRGTARKPSDVAQMRAELESLQAEEDLLAARLRVRRLQAAMNANVDTTGENLQATNKRRIKAADVEYLVPCFTGDDEYSVTKWIEDFEQIMETLHGDQDDYYKMARHLIRDTAKLYLRTIRVQDYDSLKRSLLQRYERQVSYYEIYEKLRRRHRNRDETILRYITCMQEIAQQVNMGEDELVSLIISGLRDNSAYVSILAGAQTVDALIRLLPAYERTSSLARYNAAVSTSAAAAIEHQSTFSPTTTFSRSFSVTSGEFIRCPMF